MDLLRDNVKRLYAKYLAAAFGSALMASIYSIVDMAMVGQYEGPNGTAALAVVAPVWNIIYSLGILTGVGGSVLFGTCRGRGGDGRENEYFTAALSLTAVFAVLSWLALALFETPILRFFGADDTLLPLALKYLKPINYVVPVFVFSQLFASFLRNDGAPSLATAGVLAGGVFNIFGDYFFVFSCDMGIYGAGLATALSGCVTIVVMLSHFFTKRNTLRLVRPSAVGRKLRRICVTGFATFFVDAAMGILTILFNRQIMHWLGTAALSVYGPIVNISTIVQCCGYSAGQAAQPIISVNYGAGRSDRIRSVLRYSLTAAAGFALFWTALSEAFPLLYVYVFMQPTQEILAIAPQIIRTYGISFLLLPINIFSTYYFQSIMKPAAALIVSVSRGCLLSGALILLLPSLIGADALWLAMPLTELATALFAGWATVKYTRELPSAA